MSDDHREVPTGDRFTNVRWKIIAGDMGVPAEEGGLDDTYAVIEPIADTDGEYELWSEFGTSRSKHQVLVFNAETGMLEHRAGELPERRIAYWDRQPDRARIFGFRVGVPAKNSGNSLPPWEEGGGDRGTWGAEDG